MRIKSAFKTMAEYDGFMGRAHLYIDTGATDDPDELKTPIGDGRNDITKSKIKKGSLAAVRPVEALWAYPTEYNSNNPLKSTWYRPDQWFVMGQQVHRSRFLTFVGRPVPDLLKPAYSFGGLSLTQMAKPYVDHFLRNRDSVADLIHSFSTVGIKTNLGTSLSPGGDEMFKRAELFNTMRDNRGLLILQNGPEGSAEEFFNVSTPLGTLDHLLAQSLEFIALPSGLPLLILLGIQPAGLNASSEGEIRAFYDWIHAFQEWLFRDNLDVVFALCQMSLWGAVDEELTYEFEPLWNLDEKAAAEVQKTKAETDGILIDNGTISPEEARARVAGDPDSDYQGLDPNDMPEPPIEEGLTGKGRQNEEDPDNPGEEDDDANRQAA
jgi:phage-related protein (TIGR01555 family)